ncbi:uracil-DNA glycosylase family protein [Thermincola potens]|uniref:Uracil-DNA glycosylase-like domain-containing protein n=1 Tax=Thermincola potens (strain JR) TaxID=635013 RepID=D5XF88_THEPJ|nr:uracil-DNA glycosylase family protein [Thermincola potens]ADG82309.1 conserved hypothetical protein [Thermincola potens JR]
MQNDSILSLNQQIKDVYKECWREIEQLLIHEKDISYPQLLSIPESYIHATRKVMIIGQQPFEWGYQNGSRINIGPHFVESLLELYNKFDLGRHYSSSPFWQASNELFKLLNQGTDERGFLWSNLIKIDRQNKRPGFRVEEVLQRLALLPKEIRIANPEIVIFFTGPNYDDCINSTFDGIKYEQISDTYPLLALAKLIHSELPVHSYRLYHPNYLRRSKRWELIYFLASYINNN